MKCALRFGLAMGTETLNTTDVENIELQVCF